MPLAKMRFVGIDPGGREVITAVVSRDTQKFPLQMGFRPPAYTTSRVQCNEYNRFGANAILFSTWCLRCPVLDASWAVLAISCQHCILLFQS